MVEYHRADAKAWLEQMMKRITDRISGKIVQDIQGVKNASHQATESLVCFATDLSVHDNIDLLVHLDEDISYKGGHNYNALKRWSTFNG